MSDPANSRAAVGRTGETMVWIFPITSGTTSAAAGWSTTKSRSSSVY